MQLTLSLRSPAARGCIACCSVEKTRKASAYSPARRRCLAESQGKVPLAQAHELFAHSRGVPSWRLESGAPGSFVICPSKPIFYVRARSVTWQNDSVLPHHRSLPPPCQRVVSEVPGNSFLHYSPYGRKLGKEGFTNSEKSIGIKDRAELKGALSFRDPRRLHTGSRFSVLFTICHVYGRGSLCVRAADFVGSFQLRPYYRCASWSLAPNLSTRPACWLPARGWPPWDLARWVN